MSLTNNEIMRLAAKDALIQDQGHRLLSWSKKKWEGYVDEFVKQIKELSPGRQSEIRMRYKS